MAIAENGPGGIHRGKLGNVVYYILNGKNVSREVGISTKDPSTAQLNVRLVTTMTSQLLSKLLDFLKVGFGELAKEARDNAFNQASKLNKKNIITGTYPNLKIAYNALLISKGPLKTPANLQVKVVAGGLEYSWATDPDMPWPDVNDQVMMLAYFPVKEKVIYDLFGKTRATGSDILEIPAALQGEYMETYASFISADRSRVADSIYTGNFNLIEP